MKAVEQTIEARLREAGLKATQPRIALLRALQVGHGPFSPEELFGRLDASLCDLVTVYRSLATFEERGLVRRCVFGDGKMRYEIQVGKHHHHHLVCRGCGKVRPLAHCALEGLEASLRDSGFQNISHSLEFFGTCADCITA
jgi:Fur family ferric uptake transcriptional regulator